MYAQHRSIEKPNNLKFLGQENQRTFDSINENGSHFIRNSLCLSPREKNFTWGKARGVPDALTYGTSTLALIMKRKNKNITLS